MSESTLPASIFQAIPLLIDFPVRRFWVDYDREAGVLYISFQRPQKATHTEMTDDGLLLRYQDQQMVGITVLDASTRAQNRDSLAGRAARSNV